MKKIILSFLLLNISLYAQENSDCDSSCCQASKEIVEKNNYLVITGFDCPAGYTFNKLKCIDSLNWCEPMKPSCFKLGEGETLGGIPDPGGWKTTCCPNLVDRERKSDCEFKLAGGYSYVCILCGNNICDPAFENKCNCPEDCS